MQQDSLTSSNYWTGAAVFGLAAAGLLVLLGHWIPRPRFDLQFRTSNFDFSIPPSALPRPAFIHYNTGS